MNNKLIAFKWYGGKFLHLNWLLPLLPSCRHFCEPFGGSAAVLLNREPSPIETYNDIDGEAVNFLRVLRNQKRRLIRLLELTPYSREEFTIACEPGKSLSSLERARRFFVRSRQSFGGRSQRAKPTDWSKAKIRSCGGKAETVSAWLYGVDLLLNVADRLLRVQIENAEAEHVIRYYDTPNTLFYCDPPYPLESRSGGKAYSHEMSDEQHISLSRLLHRVKGMVAVSGYGCGLMDSLYPSPRWIKTVGLKKKSPAAATKKYRQEILWTNYDPRQFTKGENGND